MSARNITANITRGRTITVNFIKHHNSASTTVDAKRYNTTFTEASLSVARVLTVTHNLGVSDLSVHIAVYDNNNKLVLVQPTLVNANSLTIDFSKITITGTWRLIVVA
jgi:hypothetical protein